MDIKNAINSVLPLNLRTKDPVDRTIKSSNTTDRDANGQQQYSQQQNAKREKMSDEQFQKAMDSLKSFPAIQENGITVEELTENEKRFVVLKDPNGNLIRRIPELDLWELPVFSVSEPSPKGQILRKTA